MNEQVPLLVWPRVWPPRNSRFHIQTWNPKSIKFFIPSSNNDGIISPTTNSTKRSPLLENGGQLNQEESKSLYPDYVFVIQDLLTLLYWNRNNNNSVWHFKRLESLNTISLNIKNSLSSESYFSKWIIWATYSRMSTWMTFCLSVERQGCTKEYDELKPFNRVQLNEILLV